MVQNILQHILKIILRFIARIWNSTRFWSIDDENENSMQKILFFLALFLIIFNKINRTVFGEFWEIIFQNNNII